MRNEGAKAIQKHLDSHWPDATLARLRGWSLKAVWLLLLCLVPAPAAQNPDEPASGDGVTLCFRTISFVRHDAEIKNMPTDEMIQAIIPRVGPTKAFISRAIIRLIHGALGGY